MTKASSLLKKQDPLMHHLLKWVPKIVININREYASAGTLDLNDLIAMGNYHLINAVDRVRRLNDPPIADLPAQEQAPNVWAYVKKSIMLDVVKDIHYVKDGVRTHMANGMLRPDAPEQDFVTQLFPDFFDEQFLLYVDNTDTMWSIIQLGIGLDEAMDEFLTFDEAKLIKLFYGIDQDKLSYKQLSKKFRKNTASIRKMKQRAVEKLKNDEARQIIQKFYDF